MVGLDHRGIHHRVSADWREAKRLQFAVGEHRVMGDDRGPGRGELISEAKRSGERGLLDATSIGDPEDAHRPTRETIEQRTDPAGDVGRHREVRLASRAHHRR